MDTPDPLEPRRRVPLYAQVLIGVAVGIGLGVGFRTDPWLFGLSNGDLGPLGLLVIRMLKALATPLIFVAILDSFLRTTLSARSGLRLAVVCIVNVSVAMSVGLVLLNVFAPGAAWQGHLEALGLAVGAKASTSALPAATLDPLKNFAAFIPENIVDPFAKNLVISVVLVAVLTGATLRRVCDADPTSPAVETTRHAVDIASRTLTAMLMRVAGWMPFAVALIIADVVGKAGIEVFGVLWQFLAIILAGLLIQALVYYPLLGWLVGRVSPRRFLTGGLDAIVTAVSSNSSLATMPVTLRCLAALGVREKAARLSACVGTNFNNDGIMLYEAMATLFLCQALGYALPLTLQLTVVLASIMAGVGIAGIPEAGLIILPLVLSAAGLPEAAVAAVVPLIVPVDWILARVRSGVNVMADMVVAMVLDRFEPG